MNSLIINQREIPFELRRSPRAKRMRLQVELNKPQLVLVAPKYAMKFEIDGFINRQIPWIEKSWKKVEKNMVMRPSRKGQDGDVYFYFGESLSLKLVPSVSWKPKVLVRGKTLEVHLHKASTIVEGRKQLKKAVEEFYKSKAAEVIHDRLEFFNEHFAHKFNRVSFRNQKTRWGSCSSAKNLNFNWRLMMAPIEIIDYVVVHELCHLKYMNHSPAFWKLVGEQIVDYKDRKKWLKDNSFLLAI